MRKAADAEVAALKQQVAQVAPLEARLKDLEAIVKAYGYTTIARGVLLFLKTAFSSSCWTSVYCSMYADVRAFL